MGKDFIPQSDAELNVWLGNFSTNIGTYGGAVGLTPADITNLQSAGTNTSTFISNVENAKANFNDMVSQKDQVKIDSIATIRDFANRIKADANYTDAIGQGLGIIGTSVAPDLANMKPGLTAETFPGYVRLKFTKKGFTGVNISTRIKGTPGWTFLARDTNSPYEDHCLLSTPGAAETREYMSIGLDGDNEIGQQSDIVTVAFSG